MVCDDPSDAGPLRHGLQAEGVPLEVIDEKTATATDLHRMAMALTDRVTVTDRECVSGLERRVIVGVGGDNDLEELLAGAFNRLVIMSRCTSLLIWIGTPGKY